MLVYSTVPFTFSFGAYNNPTGSGERASFSQTAGGRIKSPQSTDWLALAQVWSCKPTHRVALTVVSLPLAPWTGAQLEAHFPLLLGRSGKELTFIGQLLSASFWAGGCTYYLRGPGKYSNGIPHLHVLRVKHGGSEHPSFYASLQSRGRSG